ncbi:MAG: phosphoribosylaminoimidazolesuccinocarboxamide synthase [Acidobacteriaceae bacterium]|nr:phosphoribosylaminoimidazolesuccinocarboxamide synthase [Acidobacteriaceae bacterium]
MCRDQIVLETKLPVSLITRGKVRDIYAAGEDLLFIASDRISAFDCVLGTGIPHKGRVLTQMSLFWFEFLRGMVRSHLRTADVNDYPEPLQQFSCMLEGRSMLVRRARMIPIECVARGYLAGSGWKEYRASGTVCGIPLPPKLQDGSRLPEPIFTPAAKAQSGHDENIPFHAVEDQVGAELAASLRSFTLAIYQKAAGYALERGIILADTKFEFGFVGDQLVLADEVLTPDSSRYWPANTYRPGGPQFSFDKQFVRDYLETLDWDKRPPAPALPAEVVRKTSEKYQEAFERITGRKLIPEAM